MSKSRVKKDGVIMVRMRGLELLNITHNLVNFGWVGIPNLTTSKSVNKNGGWPVDLDGKVTFVVQLGGILLFSMSIM
jgi:hypothetical protein